MERTLMHRSLGVQPALLAFAFLVVTLPLPAQQPSPFARIARVLERVSVVGSIGPSFYSDADIQSALREDQSIASPRNSQKEGPWTLSLRYLLTPTLEARVLYSDARLGHTEGDGPGGWFSIAKDVRSYAAMVAVRVGKSIWLGAGPSVNRTGVYLDSATVPGVILGGSIRAPLAGDHVFFEVGLEYRYLRPVDIGPITQVPILNTTVTVEVLPRTSVSLSYGLLSVGFGVRL
jgi:hypothetical protein